MNTLKTTALNTLTLRAASHWVVNLPLTTLHPLSKPVTPVNRRSTKTKAKRSALTLKTAAEREVWLGVTCVQKPESGCLLKLKAFSKSKVRKTSISWHFILFQTAIHKILFTVLEGFLLGEQTRLRQRSKDYTSKINNKGCTHNHLSCWSYVLVYMGSSSCQQFTNDSIQESKSGHCNSARKQNIEGQ